MHLRRRRRRRREGQHGGCSSWRQVGQSREGGRGMGEIERRSRDFDDSIVVAKNEGRDIPSSSSFLPFAVQTNVNCLVSPQRSTFENGTKRSKNDATCVLRALASFAYLQREEMQRLARGSFYHQQNEVHATASAINQSIILPLQSIQFRRVNPEGRTDGRNACE